MVTRKPLGKPLDETLSDITPLAQLLGEERMDKLLDRIANLIFDRVNEDLKQYNYYLFYPANYESIVDEAFERIEKKIQKMYSDAVLENMQKVVSQYKEVTENYIKELNKDLKPKVEKETVHDEPEQDYWFGDIEP